MSFNSTGTASVVRSTLPSIPSTSTSTTQFPMSSNPPSDVETVRPDPGCARKVSHVTPWDRQRHSMRHRELTLAVHARDEKIHAIQEENQTLKLQVEKMQRKLNASQTAARNQTQAQRVQERKLDFLRGRMHGLRAEASAQRGALEKELESAAQRLSGLTGEMDAVSGQLAQAKEMCGTLTTENARCTSRIAELEHQLSVLAASAQPAPATADHSVQTSANADDAAAVAALEDRCMELESLVEHDRRLLEDYEARETVFKNLIAEARHYNDYLEESYIDILRCKDDFIRDLREDTSQLTASNRSSERHEEALESKLRRTEEKLDVTDTEVADMRVRLEGAERNAVASTNKIMQLEAETRDLRRRLADSEDERRGLQDDMDAADGLIVHLRRELQDAVMQSQDSLPQSAEEDLEAWIMDDDERSTPGLPSILEEEEPFEDETSSDEGSVDTLVDGLEGLHHRLLQAGLGHSSDSATSSSAAIVALQLEDIALKCEAARIHGDDVEEMLRAELQEKHSEKLRNRLPASGPAMSDMEPSSSRLPSIIITPPQAESEGALADLQAFADCPDEAVNSEASTPYYTPMSMSISLEDLPLSINGPDQTYSNSLTTPIEFSSPDPSSPCSLPASPTLSDESAENLKDVTFGVYEEDSSDDDRGALRLPQDIAHVSPFLLHLDLPPSEDSDSDYFGNSAKAQWPRRRRC
ncbi:hypothetical protein EVG20_g541 [Dentipellis fragilis]|uniref:Uncharacterized protein n=1 Tax=Dentipellis fragilis TaxID=205917 RepID=A0A4Y9ZDB0_9AGAM|nr:hypothetical protein EVG20_g541 [Dentipellis fragilis]